MGSILLSLLLLFSLEASSLEISNIVDEQLKEFGQSIAECDVLTVGNGPHVVGRAQFVVSNESFLSEWSNDTFKDAVCLVALGIGNEESSLVWFVNSLRVHFKLIVTVGYLLNRGMDNFLKTPWIHIEGKLSDSSEGRGV